MTRAPRTALALRIPTLRLATGAAFALPGEALAAWGAEDWGVMMWGGGIFAVPSLGWLGLALLALALAATAARRLRTQGPRCVSARGPSVALSLVLFVLAVPLGVAASTIPSLNIFVNGHVADANLVNDNFSAIRSAVNDNDARIFAAQFTANAALVNADTAIGTANSAQARVTGSCAAGSSIRAISPSGTVTCEPDDTISGGTAYSAGSGLALVGTVFSADTAVVQARVSGSCAVGQAISAIAANGTVTCETFDSASAARFEACADGLTVADHTTGLVWERKTGTPALSVLCESVGCPDPQNVNNLYEWSNTGTEPDGTAFVDFLARLNGDFDPDARTGCFDGHCDWRLPKIAELQTILVGPESAPGQAACLATPCIDPAFAAVAGPTALADYWSGSVVAGPPGFAWDAGFDNGFVSVNGKAGDNSARAVRSGSCD